MNAAETITQSAGQVGFIAMCQPETDREREAAEAFYGRWDGSPCRVVPNIDGVSFDFACRIYDATGGKLVKNPIRSFFGE